MKSMTVYAYMSDEGKGDCTVRFTRTAYYDVVTMQNGEIKATASRQGRGFASPVTIRFRASERCHRAYSMRDYLDLTESAIEEKYSREAGK